MSRRHEAIPVGNRETAVVRPKTIGRPAAGLHGALRAFNQALEATGTTSVALARAWGVNERVVRRVRDGQTPLSGERIDRSPVGVRKMFARLLLEDARGAKPIEHARPDRHALRLAARAGELAQAVHDATARDGPLDVAGSRSIARCAGRVMDAVTGVVRSIRKTPE